MRWGLVVLLAPELLVVLQLLVVLLPLGVARLH